VQGSEGRKLEIFSVNRYIHFDSLESENVTWRYLGGLDVAGWPFNILNTSLVVNQKQC